MLSRAEQAVLDAVDEQEVVDLLRALVRARSVSPPEGTEEEAARLTADRLNAGGIPARLDLVAPGRPNVLAELGDGDGPTLLWNAHLDTVPAGNRDAWQSDPFGADLRDGRIYGRGASDCKGGVAAMLAAALALRRTGRLRGRLTLCFVMGEELLPMTLVQIRPVGMLQMTDEGETDDKILAVPCGDPRFERILRSINHN